MKFEVGNRVNVIPTNEIFGGSVSVFLGTAGRIEFVPPPEMYNRGQRYYVQIDGRTGSYVFWEEQLEHAILDELAKVTS